MRFGSRFTSALFFISLVTGCLIPAFAQQQEFGDIGDLKLISGEIIRDCRIGYRTFGQLNAEKSNVIVYPTWANGRTEQMIGAAEWLGAAGYYVVAIDALSNGVSSSPSNSTLQPRMKFPKITIRDMVESQHELLTRVLHLEHVKAVMGVSMGAMQVFQWAVAYPEFVEKAVAVAGSPRLAPYDLLHWQTQIGIEPFILDNLCGHSIQACPDNGMDRAILKFLE